MGIQVQLMGRTCRTLFPLAIWALLWGATTPRALAFGRLNVLIAEAVVPARGADGVAGSLRLEPLGLCDNTMVGVLGNALLFLDRWRNRVLCLHDGTVTVFAGNGEDGDRLDPYSALQTQLHRPSKLLVLKDQSVLVSRRVRRANGVEGIEILRIRTRVQPGEASVSVFAGNGQEPGPIITGSALATPLGALGGMAQERDGSVLLIDCTRGQVLRVQTTGTIEVVAGTGVRGKHLDPGSGPRTQLGFPSAVAVLGDDSILIAEWGNRRVLRIRDDAVTVYAGCTLGAEHQLTLDNPREISPHPDGSVWLVDGMASGVGRLLRIRPTGVAQPAGGLPVPGGSELDVLYFRGLGEGSQGHITSLTPLPDGTVVLGLEERGLLLLSPVDPLQGRLEQLVNQGMGAVRAGNLGVFHQVEQELAYLCAPGAQVFPAVNRAAHDHGRLEAMKLDLQEDGRTLAVPLVPVIRELMREVHGYGERGLGEQLRAQLALRELRRFRAGGTALANPRTD